MLAGFFGVVAFGFAKPDTMVTLFWGALVPVVPAVWLLAPGLWRNTCPLATVSQLPRVFGFSRAATTPSWWTSAAPWNGSRQQTRRPGS